jgi:drug/metabolite transporter (DMT)-like permease
MIKKLWQQIFMYALGALNFIGVFAITGLLIFNAIPESNKDVLLVLLGVLASSFTAVISYFYGSSKGSADKTDIMANGKKPE